jgi:very-short-patch-repair endonuclease
MHGYRFRRQRPIGTFLVDFACLEASLIIEVDGGQHAEQIAKDEARTRFLEKTVFALFVSGTMMFWAIPRGVLEAILHDLQNSPQEQP